MNILGEQERVIIEVLLDKSARRRLGFRTGQREDTAEHWSNFLWLTEAATTSVDCSLIPRNSVANSIKRFKILPYRGLGVA